MESLEFQNSYDSDVGTFLCGLNLSNYIETFSKQAIDLEVFLTLTNEDLCFVGISDSEDRKTLLNGIANFKSHRKNFSNKNDADDDIKLSDKDALTIATNTMKQLSMLHAALAHTRLRLKTTPVRNTLIEQHSVASLVDVLAEEAISQNLIVQARLLGLENIVESNLHPTRYAVKRRIGWLLFVASTLTVLSVFGLRVIKYSR